MEPTNETWEEIDLCYCIKEKCTICKLANEKFISEERKRAQGEVLNQVIAEMKPEWEMATYVVKAYAQSLGLSIKE